MAARWLLLGDSHLEAIAPRLSALLRTQGIDTMAIVRRGHGALSFIGDPEVAAAVQQFRPTATILFLGGNDGRSDGEVQRNRQLLSEVPNPVWVGPWFAEEPAVQARHLRADQAIRTATVRAGVPYVDGQHLSPRGRLQSDGVHYTQGGYAEIARGLVAPLVMLTKKTPWWALAIGAGLGIGLVWWLG